MTLTKYAEKDSVNFFRTQSHFFSQWQKENSSKLWRNRKGSAFFSNVSNEIVRNTSCLKWECMVTLRNEAICPRPSVRYWSLYSNTLNVHNCDCNCYCYHSLEHTTTFATDTHRAFIATSERCWTNLATWMCGTSPMNSSYKRQLSNFVVACCFLFSVNPSFFQSCFLS